MKIEKNQVLWASVVVAALAMLNNPAHAKLLVHEPFDYPEGNLTGQGGALGTTNTWASHDTLQGNWPMPTTGWWVHQEGNISGVGLSSANPSIDPGGWNPYDGTVENLVTSGGYAGLPGAADVGDPDPNNGEPGRHMDASIGLDPSVTATFLSNNITWFSFVSVRGWDRNEESPQFMICTDPTPDNAREFTMNTADGGNGIGGGGAPPRANYGDILPSYFKGGVAHTTPGGYLGGVLGGHDGVQDQHGSMGMSDGALETDVQTMTWVQTDPVTSLFGTPHIVVGKIEWDADTGGEDIISVVRFLQNETINEAAFDALIASRPALSSVNWASNKPDLDQSRFDTLNFSGTKYFVDEVRIATTFPEVVPNGGLIVTKSVSESIVYLEQGATNLIYTIEIINGHTTALGGIVVTDSLPAEVSFVSSIPAANQTNGSEYVFNIGTLETNSNSLIMIEVAVTSTVPGVITNFASAVTTNTDVTLNISQDRAETLLYLPTDILALTKTVSRSETNLYFTLTVTNLSAVNAGNVTVVDTLPGDLIFQSGVPNPTTNGNDYTFSLGALAPGASASISLSASFTSTVPSIVTNVATAATATFEDVFTNNTASVTAPIGSTLDLALIKTVNPTNLPVGSSNLTYTINIMNFDTQFVCGVVVTDTIPIALQYLFATPPAFETNGDSYVFNLGCMAPGSSTSIVINAAYTSAVGGITLTNWANVHTTNEEFILNNNFDSALTTVGAPCSTNDTDGDGMSDCDEICAGTDPLDPTSYLWIQIARLGTSDVQRLTFPTITGRMYRVESSTNLYGDFWRTVFSNLTGLGASRNLMYTNPLQRVYYRIGVESP